MAPPRVPSCAHDTGKLVNSLVGNHPWFSRNDWSGMAAPTKVRGGTNADTYFHLLINNAWKAIVWRLFFTHYERYVFYSDGADGVGIEGAGADGADGTFILTVSDLGKLPPLTEKNQIPAPTTTAKIIARSIIEAPLPPVSEFTTVVIWNSPCTYLSGIRRAIKSYVP